jgi:chromosome segregation ATPase
VATFLLQELETMPVVMGKTGTVLLALITFALAILNAFQFYKAKNIERLNSALHTTETEMNVYKSRAERQSKELAEANQTIGELKAKTDLSEVLKMLNETITLTRESVDLSRKFDRENSQLNVSFVRSLEKHAESDREIFGDIAESLKQNTQTLSELETEIRSHRKDAAQMVRGLTDKIDELKAGNS